MNHRCLALLAQRATKKQYFEKRRKHSLTTLLLLYNKTHEYRQFNTTQLLVSDERNIFCLPCPWLMSNGSATRRARVCTEWLTYCYILVHTKVDASLEAVYDDADLIAGDDMRHVDTLDSMDCSFYLGERDERQKIYCMHHSQHEAGASHRMTQNMKILDRIAPTRWIGFSGKISRNPGLEKNVRVRATFSSC